MLEISSFAACSAPFNLFFFDQFGVLHDGQRRYPSAINALHRLKARGAKIVILSNSGRSGKINAQRLEKMGFAPSLYDHFVTSGDVALNLLRLGALPIKFSSETRCFTISTNDTADLASELELRSWPDAYGADLIVISGCQPERFSMIEYRAMLEPAARRNVPCLCTNPDKLMLTARGTMAGSGAIAEIYEKLGGTVHWIGKPFPSIYCAAAALLGAPAAPDILCVGDSIEHDVVGAHRFGAPVALVRTGILADLPEAELQQEFVKYRAVPDFLLAGLE